MFAEDDLVPLSALAHLYFCSRRAGLTLLEQQWNENQYTAEGSVLHKRAHGGESESRPGVRVSRSVRVRSLRLGIAGAIDCLEFVRLSDGARGGVKLADSAGLWLPVPVEYKHGAQRDEREYEIQLCAEALCLEEMLETRLDHGYIYYEASRRRLAVSLTPDLREQVEEGAHRLHEMVSSGVTPTAERGPKCNKCSMTDICVPGLRSDRAGQYLAEMLRDTTGGTA